MENHQSAIARHQFLALWEARRAVRQDASVIPIHLYLRHSHLRHVVTGRECELHALGIRSAVGQQQGGRALYLGRIAQLEGGYHWLHDVASHIAKGTRTIVPPSSPVPGMIYLIERTHLRRAGKQVPVEGLRNTADGLRRVQALWPDRTVGGTLHLGHLTYLTVPNPLAHQVGAFGRRALVAHLGSHLVFISQLGEQTGLIHRMCHRLLGIYMLAHSHRVGSDDGVGMVGCRAKHGIKGAAHLVKHLAVVPILLGVGEASHHILGVLPIYIAQSHDVVGLLHVLDVAVAHTADTYSGNVQFVRRSQ